MVCANLLWVDVNNGHVSVRGASLLAGATVSGTRSRRSQNGIDTSVAREQLAMLPPARVQWCASVGAVVGQWRFTASCASSTGGALESTLP